MIVSIGDTQIDNARPWSSAISKEVVNFIINSPHNKPENTAVFLGDLVEKSKVSGEVFDYLMQIFVGLKYKKAYILVGNHDGQLWDGKVDLVYDFLKNPEVASKITTPIEVVYGAKAIEIDGIKTLFLSHIFNDGKQSLKDYEKLPAELSEPSYDVIFGHFQKTSLGLPGESIDVSYLKTKYSCYGHIHNPSDDYQGSLVPNSVSEGQHKHQIRLYLKNRGVVVQTIEELEVELADYYSVTFPNSLPEVTAKVPIWTIDNCKDIQTAKAFYGDIFIRKTIYNSELNIEELQRLTEKLKKKGKASTLEMFEEFVSQSKLTVELTNKARGYLVQGLEGRL